ncbi:Beta-catenin [Trema orientale]|uniref:Beta-catenin n=1 Tax=Trema orientale TaxID=63057 RepID=A0A2P5E7C4_TREOI|nr:Beta-catenin [Trema orientale]
MDYCSSSSSPPSSASSTPSSLSNEGSQAAAAATTDTNSNAETTSTMMSTSPVSSVRRALLLVQSDDVASKLEGAREIRRLTKTSQRCRRLLSDSVGPLISMLRLSHSPDSIESALLALLNLAVRDEMNKTKIVEAGALEPIISFLTSESSNLQEYATASLLTLSASTNNKPVIGASGAIPLLVETLRRGSSQAKVDAVMALSNLSTYPSNLSIILDTKPIPSIVNLLKTCKKSSKTAEKCCALIESLVGFDEGRTALTSEEGGVLAVVEVLENGSLQSREHAVGTLLTMCQSDRCRYREPILKEGVIPGLLELTVQGTPKSQTKAQTLLRLLRDSPYPRSELQPDTLENIVCNIISQIDGDDQSGKAKKMLAEMVQVSMEQSLRHLQQRALVCTPSDLPISTSCTSKVSSK